jgi:hypothetical protein
VGSLLAKSPRLAPRADRIDGQRWGQLVGERVAARTRPGSIRDGTLLVYVASPVWAQELTFLAPAILERLVGAGVEVKELRFRVGDVGREPSATAKPVPEAPPDPRKADLPADLRKKLEGIQDPALRAAIAEAAAYSLGRAEKPSGGPRAPRFLRSGASKTGPTVQTEPPPRGAPKDTGGKRSY